MENKLARQFYSAIPKEDQESYKEKGLTYVDPSNKTALHVYLKTAKAPQPEVVNYLIEEGCLVNNIWKYNGESEGNCLQILIN